MTDWNQRVKDCKRRASIAYPQLLMARKAYYKYNRLWIYWENRAWDAQRNVIAATVVPPNMTKQSVERHKERIIKAIKSLDVDQRKELLEELKGGL